MLPKALTQKLNMMRFINFAGDSTWKVIKEWIIEGSLYQKLIVAKITSSCRSRKPLAFIKPRSEPLHKKA